MDTTCDKFRAGRRKMIDAFVAVSDLARSAGVDETRISELHGEFFDGNVETKDAFGVAVLLARCYQAGSAAGRGTIVR